MQDKAGGRESDSPAFPLPTLRYGRAMIRAATSSVLLLLAACGPAGNDPGAGGVTVDEAKALDRAAEMLEERRLPDEALSKPAVEGEPAPDNGADGAAPEPAAQQ